MLPSFERTRQNVHDRVLLTDSDTATGLVAHSYLSFAANHPGEYLTLGDIEWRSEHIRQSLSDTLADPEFDVRAFLDVIQDLDEYLHIFARDVGIFDGNDAFKNILEMVLPDTFYVQLEQQLSLVWSEPFEGRDVVPEIEKKQMVAFIVLKNMASFGLWRAVLEAKRSKQKYMDDEEEGERAFVGAVAIGFNGEILAAAYRGEDPVLARHAEDVLLNKLREQNLLDKVCLIATNLEPCKERSEKHSHALGHRDGCSTLLLQTNIPVMAYIQADRNGHGRGRGGECLIDGGKVVFVADDPAALQSSALLQVYKHLRENSESSAQ